MSEPSYREQALKIYPWICGRCGREFKGANLRELTVHHRDHNFYDQRFSIGLTDREKADLVAFLRTL
jgi:hypothetical protein